MNLLRSRMEGERVLGLLWSGMTFWRKRRACRRQSPKEETAGALPLWLLVGARHVRADRLVGGGSGERAWGFLRDLLGFRHPQPWFSSMLPVAHLSLLIPTHLLKPRLLEGVSYLAGSFLVTTPPASLTSYTESFSPPSSYSPRMLNTHRHDSLLWTSALSFLTCQSVPLSTGDTYQLG